MDYYNEIAAAGNSTASSVVGIIGAVIGIIALWKIFEKAGEQGWKAIIPLYDTYTFVKILEGNGWKFLLLLIPVVNIVYAIMLLVKLAKAFGKSTGFAIGLIFLSPIFMLILAFDGSVFRGTNEQQNQ